MRNILLIIAGALAISGCKKDKFTTAPQITYKSITPLTVSSTVPNAVIPRLTINVTDSEGDLGFIDGEDSSWIFTKLLLTNKIDSFLLPNIAQAATKRFQADIALNLPLQCKPIPGGLLHVDTLIYEVYVKDFAKNKSNVIRTNEAVLYQCR